MAVKALEPEEGDAVRLLGPPQGKPLKEWFNVIKVRDKATLRVEGGGGCFFVHKSRVTELRKKGTPLLEAQTNGLGDLEAEAEAKEETVSETAVAEKPATKTTKPAAAKKQVKEPPKPKPFDLNGFVKEHGGIHLSKPGTFDHKDYKLICHLCVDEKAGFYHTFNTYLYPDGTNSLGKKGKGGNSYPLKGHRHTVEKTSKKGTTTKEVHKGTKTAEEVVASYEKKGYKKTNREARSAKSSAQLAAVKMAPAAKPQAAAKPAAAPPTPPVAQAPATPPAPTTPPAAAAPETPPAAE